MEKLVMSRITKDIAAMVAPPKITRRASFGKFGWFHRLKLLCSRRPIPPSGAKQSLHILPK